MPDDPFEDPQFPDRPTHRDFYRLMDAASYVDGKATEGGEEVTAIAAEFVDPESLEYIAINRGMMAARVTGLPVHVLAGIWMDAFCIGARFEKLGGHVGE